MEELDLIRFYRSTLIYLLRADPIKGVVRIAEK